MTDTANAPERIWTADTTGNCSVGFNTPSLDYKNEYISRTHCDELVAAARAEGAREAQAKIARLTEALTLIERVYYMEGKANAWRAARMNGIANSAQNGVDLAEYRRLFPRASLQENADE